MMPHKCPKCKGTGKCSLCEGAGFNEYEHRYDGTAGCYRQVAPYKDKKRKADAMRRQADGDSISMSDL